VNLLCTIIDSICPASTGDTNSLLATDIVSDYFKSAIVKPEIIEPGLNIENMTSYRQLSLTSFKSKVVGYVRAQQLVWH